MAHLAVFLYLAQMITSMRDCVACNDLWPWPISSRSFSHDFAKWLQKYGTSCSVCSAALKVLDEFFLYLAQMITSIRRCVGCNDLCPWPISSRFFSCEIVYFMDYMHMYFCSWAGGGGILVDHWFIISSLCREYLACDYLMCAKP